MRSYRYKIGQVVKVNNKYRGVILAVLKNNEENRRLLVNCSGFDSVEEWLDTAKKLHRGKIPRFIILLQRIPD